MLTLVVLSVVLLINISGSAAESCETNTGMDVFFIVDASDCISMSSYEELKQSLANLTLHFGEANQYGVIIFDSNAYISITLDYFSQTSTLQEEILSLPYLGGSWASLHKALVLLKREGFMTNHGDRLNARNVAVILSSSKVLNIEMGALLNIINDIKSDGVSVISLGYGELVDGQLLEELASTVDHSIISTIPNTKADLLPLIQNISNDCADVPQTEPCKGELDIFFVLDTSTSTANALISDEYDPLFMIKSKIATVINSLGEGTRIGFINYAKAPTLEFGLNEHNDRESVLEAVDSVELLNGTTDTEHALKFLSKIGFTEGNGDRTHVPNVVVLITDGYSEGNPIREAWKLHNADVTVITVAIGNTIDKFAMEAMASHPGLSIDLDSLSGVIFTELQYKSKYNCVIEEKKKN